MLGKEVIVGLIQRDFTLLKTSLSCAHAFIVVQEQSTSKLPALGICYYHQQSSFFSPLHCNIDNCKLEKLHPGKNDLEIKNKKTHT